MATFIDSSRNYADLNVLVYELDAAADKLIEAIYRNSRIAASKRLVIKDGKYMYTPSDEYNSVPKLIRFKNFKR